MNGLTGLNFQEEIMKSPQDTSHGFLYINPATCMSLLLVLVLVIPTSSWALNQKKKEAEPGQMTALQLQSELMSFGDRFATILGRAGADYSLRAPTPEARVGVRLDLVQSVTSAFSIAAEPNPEIALLDMVVLTTLGRVIYEEHWRPKEGDSVDVIINAFRKLEADVSQIAQRVLSEEEQADLQSLIYEWRENNPEEFNFEYLRFSDFAKERSQSTLAKAVESGGMFASIHKATTELEKTRLLVERSMYLATRMPFLTGHFVDVWLSQWIMNPEVTEILTDLHAISESSKSLASAADQLPAVAQQVRKAGIDHFMDRLSEERKSTMQDFIAEEERLRGLLTELRQAVTESNNLILSADSLAKRLGYEPGAPFEFNLNNYRETIVEATDGVRQLEALISGVNQLMLSPGWENTLPRIVEAVDKIETEGEKWIGNAFLLGMVMIASSLAGILLVMLVLIRYAAKKFAGLRKEQGTA
jgi:hypothetical protein